MKRRDLIRKIAAEAAAQGHDWSVEREGGRHTVYRLGNLRIPIPRHNEVGEMLAREICKECEPVLGKGWWR